MGYLGQDDRIIPTAGQITPVPVAGKWYRIKRGETWWGTAKKAYGPAPNLRIGLLQMNASTWNDHIDRKRRGWESYNRPGLQATPDYSVTDPHAPKGSGTAYPVAWVPPLTGEEPEEVYPPEDPIVGPGIPGPRGPIGPIGPSGPRGTPGTIGPIGPGGSEGPPGQATDEAIMRAVTDWMNTHPDEIRGPAGQTGVPGTPGAEGPPGQATDEAIMRAVTDWMNTHPDEIRGPRGASGDMGPIGPLGPVGPVGPEGPMGPAGEGGSGGGNMWMLPMVALLSLL